ncbi:MAG: tetratricopeptide repeat protein [Acidobacteriia bacterium]|nr:tetratricopeptide repeat protein [Terriglobia bacterium]
MNKPKILKSAEKYVLQGKLPSAISEYKKILEIDPNDLGILNIIGDLYVRMGNTPEGLKYFQRLATAFRDSGYKVKAIAIYKKITKLDSTDVDACRHLAELYAMQGLMSEAREQYFQLAEAYAVAGKLAEAAEALRRFLAGHAGHVEGIKRLVDIELRRDNPSAALELLVSAAETQRHKGAFEEARQLLDRAQEIGAPAVTVQLAKAKILLAEKKTDAAIRMLQTIDPEKTVPEVQLALFEGLLAEDRVAEAKEIANALFEHDTAHFPLLFSVSERYLASSDLDGAIAALDPLVNAPSMEVFAHRLSESLQKILSENPDCLPAIERAVTVQRKTGQTHKLALALEHLASYYIKKENFKAALEVYRELLNIDPGNSIIRKGMEHLEMQLGGAPPTPPVETSTSPQIPPTWSSIPEAESSSERESSQEFSLREPSYVGAPQLQLVKPLSVEDREDTSELTNRLILEGEFLYSYGLLNSAAGSFEDVMRISPGHLLAMKRLVDIYSATDRLGDAAGYAAKISKIAFRQGQVEEAQRWTEKATQLDQGIQSQKINVEDGTPSSASLELIPPAKEAASAVQDGGVYDLSEELDQISSSAPQESAGEARPGSTATTPAPQGRETLSEPLEEIDFYMAQGFWAEAQFLIERWLVQKPASVELQERLKKCESMSPAMERPSAAAQSSEVTPKPEDVTSTRAAEEVAKDTPPAVVSPIAEPVFDDLLTEFDISGSVTEGSADFNTHYNLGIAFREMGLMEEAIAELHKAASLITPDAPKKNFLDVCSLLGLCYADANCFPDSIEWLERGLKYLDDQSSEQALSFRYDLANAYQLSGDDERSAQVFREIQAQNAGFRDVAKRLQAFEHS